MILNITHIKIITGHTWQWVEYRRKIPRELLNVLRRELQEEYEAIVDFRYEETENDR